MKYVIEEFGRNIIFDNVIVLFIPVKIASKQAGGKTSKYMYYTYYEQVTKKAFITSCAHRTRVQFRLTFT